ncbi:hypothetical protein PHYSODRAFT_285565 [Phytophthora sojae]|uniref:RxLR effector protein n=2 Tax=Phytophthora sojae TaxID=67593 RepID=G4Z994_PHYSP|nr:hypothetical protein PHYSODRAFT_285565 [Phytophthora sojae]AEK80948.1 Avh217 [Phytophthora sojae]AEK80949.1 Avh217 [Phytophthora sojae]AEK80950.1 Avh217 [Phytophthora sojae]EGZ21148.1 hypothetical protein PHYSODRAFT_285565 [Phytophthora sojae]|eukprot:XP_009523865.1 hypothetical protein PHYSODRAFT_285565 [Phytophthora sojae]
MAAQRFVLLLAAAILLVGNAAATLNGVSQAVSIPADEKQSAHRLLRSHKSGNVADEEEERSFGSAKDPDAVSTKLGLASVRGLADNLDVGQKWFKAILKFRAPKKASMYFPDEYI